MILENPILKILKIFNDDNGYFLDTKENINYKILGNDCAIVMSEFIIKKLKEKIEKDEKYGMDEDEIYNEEQESSILKDLIPDRFLIIDKETKIKHSITSLIKIITTTKDKIDKIEEAKDKIIDQEDNNN